MEEPPDEDLKDETHTGLDDGYADRQSLDPHEPDFDGVDHDHSSSSGEGSLALSHESPTISDRDTYNPHESHLAKGSSSLKHEFSGIANKISRKRARSRRRYAYQRRLAKTVPTRANSESGRPGLGYGHHSAQIWIFLRMLPTHVPSPDTRKHRHTLPRQDVTGWNKV